MRIGEAAAAAGTTTKALRFYEERGLLPHVGRTDSGYRDYSPAMVSRLEFIRRSKRTTVSELRRTLTAADPAACEPTQICSYL